MVILIHILLSETSVGKLSLQKWFGFADGAISAVNNSKEHVGNVSWRQKNVSEFLLLLAAFGHRQLSI